MGSLFEVCILFSLDSEKRMMGEKRQVNTKEEDRDQTPLAADDLYYFSYVVFGFDSDSQKCPYIFFTDIV